MNSNIKYLFSVFACATFFAHAGEVAFEKVVVNQVKAGGFVESWKLYKNPDERLSPIGRVLFDSEALSLNMKISCRTCHIDKFGSADGIPSAAALGGVGDSSKRLLSGAKQLPRNTLALWGRGAVGFETFFWDGRVNFIEGKNGTQFGSQAPSKDAFIVAAHLPVIEIREMLDEDDFVRKHKLESVEKSKVVYRAIAQNVVKKEPEQAQKLAKELNKNIENLDYVDFARALVAFMRDEFRIKPTKLEKFVSGKEKFSKQEILGALIFYGKGGCISCHSGGHFSNFTFQTIPFPQLGFGKNGFGVDYGRYNATFNPRDMYKFRVPPLYNVEKTAPYGHDGSVRTLEDAVTAHFDPLKLVNVTKMNGFERHEFFKRLSLSDSPGKVSYLSDEEVKNVVSFLKTLSF
jgi:cytochrome c peroxidase